jgi:hypothetical protein
MIDLTKKEALQVLLKLPDHSFKAVIKLINPKLNDNDLRPMFPEGWDRDECWPDGNYNYDAFRKYQVVIDQQAEEVFNWVIENK